MNLKIQGPNVGVTPALHAYAQKQVNKLTRVHDGIVSIQVLMSVDCKKKGAGNAQQAQMIVRLKQQCGEIVAQHGADNMYTALDHLGDKICNQVVRRIETRAKPARGNSPRREM